MPVPVLSTRDITMDKTHKSPPFGTYIEGLVEGMARQSNKWYSVLEGDGAKEKYRARKDRPKGWSEFALLNKIREDYRKRWQSQLCVSPRQREEVQRAWGQQEQRGGRRDEDKLWASDCEHCGIYCDVKTRYAGEEFAPRRFRVAVSLYGLIIHCILPFL